MKANEAPEKIYIQPNAHDGWLEINPNSDMFVEYVRKDVVIEKACEYLMDYEFHDSLTIADRRKRVEDFKKYMEDSKVWKKNRRTLHHRNLIPLHHLN